jgi:IclR family KDG regulon transcriptional repressor
MKRSVLEVRKQGIAYDREEDIEGRVAFAIPIKANSRDLQAVIWAVGLDAPGVQLVHPGVNRLTERDLRRD